MKIPSTHATDFHQEHSEYKSWFKTRTLSLATVPGSK